MNWGAMAQNLETSINISNASGNSVYSNTESYELINPGDSMSLYHSSKFLPSTIGNIVNMKLQAILLMLHLLTIY